MSGILIDTGLLFELTRLVFILNTHVRVTVTMEK